MLLVTKSEVYKSVVRCLVALAVFKKGKLNKKNGLNSYSIWQSLLGSNAV